MIAIPTSIEVAPVGAPRYRCAAPAELRREERMTKGFGTTCYITKASPLLKERDGEVGLVKLGPYALIAVAPWWLLLCLPMKEGEKALGGGGLAPPYPLCRGDYAGLRWWELLRDRR